jgi:hypothetical protein
MPVFTFISTNPNIISRWNVKKRLLNLCLICVILYTCIDNLYYSYLCLISQNIINIITQMLVVCHLSHNVNEL